MTRFVWGTVTDVSPLRVMLDGDTIELPFTPDSLVDPVGLTVTDRVRCEVSDRRVVIHGRSAGSDFAPGDIIWTGAASARAGFLLCDGSAVSRTTYAALFAAIGTTYGAGDGSTTFNVPNLKGRVSVGRDSGQTEFDTLGETGGAKTHTLTTAEVPNIPVGLRSVGGVDQSTVMVSDGSSGSTGNRFRAATGTGAYETLRAQGGGGAHNNLQPYLVLNGIIKI